MSTARATKLLLDRLGAGATVLLSLHLRLLEVPAWCDGADAEGRAVLLVGKHQLGESDEAQGAVGAVLDAFRQGHVPEGVVSIAFGPMASAAFAEIVAGTSEQVLCDGPRASGKTQMIPGALAALAELHVREGFTLPLRVSWLHVSLLDASIKTGASLEEPHWSGLWTLHDDRRRAILTLAGTQCVLADFVGTRDESAAERLRASAHVIAAEELIPTLDEGGGIDERRFDTARSSLLRLPARRRVAIATTNPGAPDTWPYRRWIEGGGQPGCVRCPIPASDRLNEAEILALRQTFRDSPDLEQRLALGEWVGLKLGEVVAEGFDPAVHVAPDRLEPSPDHLLAIGWDGGHSPSAVPGQLIGGQVRIYAALNDLKVGVLELIETQVIPWLIQHAPWTRQSRAASTLVHVIDPNMATPGQASIHESAERVIRDMLGGRIVKGPVGWSPRREAVLRVLAPRHEQGRVPLLIAPGPETRLLVGAFTGRWFYSHTPDGRVDRSRPKKPNSPWADIGDAAAYLLNWLLGGELKEARPRSPEDQYAKTTFDRLGPFRGDRRDPRRATSPFSPFERSHR